MAAKKKKSEKLSHSHKSSSKKQDLIANAYKRLRSGKPAMPEHTKHHNMPHESIRELEHNGHKIVISTKYDIRVDGKSLKGHVYVDNSGKVSSHVFPTYSFVSTSDLIKKIIDVFPENFKKPEKKKGVKKGGRSKK